MDFQTLESGSLPANKNRLIKTLADSTIGGIVDAIVELVTNSDDSYARSEQIGKKLSGRIDISLERSKGGHCGWINVLDEASGMSHQMLKKAIEFSGETSGFKEGGNVRGFFGRGLKESIIALGRGEILTLSDGVLSRGEIYYDELKKDCIYSLSVPIANLSETELLKFGFIGKSGTLVNISVKNPKKDFIPGRNNIEDEIKNLYALRDINSSPDRNVYLHFKDLDSKDKFSFDSPIRFARPQGVQVFNDEIQVLNYPARVIINESAEQLETPRIPSGTAGLLIKASGAILDNQLFGFETDPTALYFFGEIICPGIAEIIRSGDESIIDYNRGGLEKRHPFTRELDKIAREILTDLINKKREKLNIEKQTKVSEPIEKVLNDLCRKLADLAKSEIEEKEPGPGEVDSFTIRPLFANIEPGIYRKISIYCPDYLATEEGGIDVSVKSSNPAIKIDNEIVKLEHSKKAPETLKTTCGVIGYSNGETSTITASLGRLLASCEVRVAPMKKGRKRHKRNRDGGLFRKIEPALDNEPIQRFEYIEGGTIKIYTKFPGVNMLLGDRFEKINSPEGKIVMAEILIEAFSRYLSRKRAGRHFSEEIDPMFSDMDRLRRKVSPVIYNALLNYDLSELVQEN